LAPIVWPGLGNNIQFEAKVDPEQNCWKVSFTGDNGDEKEEFYAPQAKSEVEALEKVAAMLQTRANNITSRGGQA
jgi:hypothetical protein